MGKQDPKSILKRAKNQGPKADGKEGRVSAPSGGFMGGEFSNNLSRQAGGLFPDIDQEMNIFCESSFDQSRFPFTGENEDSQRYQFEETTFAAPNILRELAEILSRFAMAFKNYSERTTLYDPETGDPLLADSLRPSTLIPGGVKELLNQSWSDLTSDVMYATRVWQSTPTRNITKQTTRSVGKMEVIPGITSASTKIAGVGEKKNTNGELKNIADLLEEDKNKNRTKKDGELAENRTYDYKKKGKSKDSTQLLSVTPGKTVEVLFLFLHSFP